MSNAKFDLVVVGSGFASSFFLQRFLRHASDDSRILVCERGEHRDHAWQREHPIQLEQESRATYVRAGSDQRKAWRFDIAFGGSSNCWWAITPRMFPADFEMESRYGVGRDWPLSYDELEEYYGDAEELMQVSGDDDFQPVPRSRKYPQPPHRLTRPGRQLAEAFPEDFGPQPTARPRKATDNRPACCGSGVCTLCPIDSKFTILNEMSDLYDDQRVTVQLNTEVIGIETNGGRVSGVRCKQNGREKRIDGDLVVLGANGVFNPFLLLRSNIDDGPVGKGLVERVSQKVVVHLDDLDGFGGSTSTCGQGYMLYDGEHRKDKAGCMIDVWNVPLDRANRTVIRDEPGRWTEVMELRLRCEDLRRPEKNFVAFDPGRPNRPILHFEGRSQYARDGLQHARKALEEVLEPLPVERVFVNPQMEPTDQHILGTTVMGKQPEDSVVDRDLRHHRLRNLLVLGSGAFPTAPPANPTLTLCALSLRAADRLF